MMSMMVSELAENLFFRKKLLKVAGQSLLESRQRNMSDRIFSHPLSPSVLFFCLLAVVRVFLQFCDNLFASCVLCSGFGLGVGCFCVRLEKAQKVPCAQPRQWCLVVNLVGWGFGFLWWWR
jgi:hypothetical protein